MKHIKLFEAFSHQSEINNYDPKRDPKNIHEICKKYGIRDYTINSDGSVDVKHIVHLNGCNLTELPLIFNNAEDSFICSDNKLTSLFGAPKYVGGNFNCRYNRLETLEGGPEIVRHTFNADHNLLTNLEFCPTSVGQQFNVEHNKINNLDYCPESFKYFYCSGNPIDEVYSLFDKESRCIKYIHEYDVIQGGTVIYDRVLEVYSALNMPVAFSREIMEDVVLKSYLLV